MPFVRHRLGGLRLKRIPELHVEQDDTAERGTRVLQILDELEHGEDGEADAERTADAAAAHHRPRHAGAARATDPKRATRAPAGHAAEATVRRGDQREPGVR